jgi:hypothetical protein
MSRRWVMRELLYGVAESKAWRQRRARKGV